MDIVIQPTQIEFLQDLLVASKAANHDELSKLCEKCVELYTGVAPTATISKCGTVSKNQAFRFSLGEDYTDVKKTSHGVWGFKPSRRSIFGLNSDSQDYEDVVNYDILKAPVCDICVVARNDPTPTGFYRVAKTPGNLKANMNNGSGGKTMYLCIKKDLSGDQIPVVNLIVIFPDRGEVVPPTFFVVKRGTQSCNINTGTNAERIYICYKKDKWGNPITDIQMIFLGQGEGVPRSFNMVDQTSSGLLADLNTGTGGVKALLTYKQSLLRLECFSADFTGSALSNMPRSRSPDDTATCKIDSPLSLGLASENSLDSITSRCTPDTAVTSVEYLQEDSASGRTRTETLESLNSSGKEDADMLEHSDEDETESIDSNEDIILYDTRIIILNGSIAPSSIRVFFHCLLVSLYIRHGAVADLSIHFLTSLLKETEFFSSDLKSVPGTGFTTLLDLTIECVCDNLESCIESRQVHLLEFLQVLIIGPVCILSPNALHRIVKACQFLCSCAVSSAEWFTLDTPAPIKDDSELEAFKLLKQLIWSNLAQVKSAGTANRLPDSGQWSHILSVDSEEELETTTINMVRNMAFELIDDIIDSVEIAKISEITLSAVSRVQTASTSNKFWFKIVLYSKKLFSQVEFRNVFLIMCALCKMARLEVREGIHHSRDLGNKLIALEAIVELCGSASDCLTKSKVMGYQVRRIVVSCVLSNVTDAFTDIRIFSKLLRVISVLWRMWRTHLRIEFAILCEQLIIRVLQASATKVKPDFKMVALEEVVNWFDRPHILLEMFLNFDMDRKFVSHWNVFSHLTLAICALAERVIAPVDMTGNKEDTLHTERLREVSEKALEVVAQIAKTLMDASGHAHLIAQDPVFRSRTLAAGLGWEEDETEEDAVIIEGEDLLVSSAAHHNRRIQGVRFRKAVNQEANDVLDAAISIYRQKNSLNKAIDYLVKKNFMGDTAQELASFLRLYKNSFDPSAIGDFLGEGGITPKDIEYWSQVRYRYTRAVSFAEMSLEKALRLFLTGCGFRLPGESQKIDRFVDVFAKVYWQDNEGTSFCPFRHIDTVHLVSFALIMLNTDLHRASTEQGKKKRKKMTKEQFIWNLREVDAGQNVDKDYLSMMYDNIQAGPIEMEVHSSEAQKGVDSPEAVSIRGVSNKFLSDKSDSSVDSQGVGSETMFCNELSRCLRDAEDVLRVLAPFTHRFQITGVDVNISRDLIRFMFEAIWLNIHAIVDLCLSSIDNNEFALFTAVDICCSALTSTVFLDLQMERLAFATLLVNFRKICRKCAESHIKTSTGGTKDTSGWYELILNANVETAMDAISHVHCFILLLKDDIRENKKKDVMQAVVNKIEKTKNPIMQSNVSFLREGDLSKRSRAGRLDNYHFFLFSDTLLYTHIAMSGLYKVHEQLPLLTMVVADNPEDQTGCSLYITHPKKSFMVTAENTELKRAWYRDMVRAIEDSKRRAIEQSSVEAKVRIFLSRRDPSKLDDLTALMVQYKGRESELLSNLEKEYGDHILSPSSPTSSVNTSNGDVSPRMYPRGEEPSRNTPDHLAFDTDLM